MSTKKVFIILSVIIVVGGFLRFYKLGEQPLVTDEFLDMNATYGYFKTGKFQAWDFNLAELSQDQYPLRDERSWAYRWQAAQLFRWFSPTETVARSVSVFWGIISIVIMYLVGTYYSHKKIVGIMAAFLFAVSISGIIFDRMLRMYAMFFPVFLLFSWFTYRVLEEEYQGKILIFSKIQEKLKINAVWLLPAAIFGLLSFHLHPLALNMGVILIVYFLVRSIMLMRQRRVFISKYSVYLILIIGVVIIASLAKPKVIAPYLGVISLSSGDFSYFLAAVSDYISPALAWALIFLAVFSARNDPEKFKGLLWNIACLLSVILAATLLWKQSFGPRFIFFVESFTMILMASGIHAVAIFLRDNSLKFKKEIFAGTIAFFLLIAPNYVYFFEKENIYHRNPADPDYRKAYQYFLKKSGAQDALMTKNFRSYYYRDAGAKVENIKSGKVSSVRLSSVVSENPSGWLISGDIKGDFEKDARNYIEKNLKLEKEISGVMLYRWGNPEEKN